MKNTHAVKHPKIRAQITQAEIYWIDMAFLRGICLRNLTSVQAGLGEVTSEEITDGMTQFCICKVNPAPSVAIKFCIQNVIIGWKWQIFV